MVIANMVKIFKLTVRGNIYSRLKMSSLESPWCHKKILRSNSSLDNELWSQKKENEINVKDTENMYERKKEQMS